MILHTISTSPSTTAFDDCLRVANKGDAILLLGDAVYAALDETEACRALQACGASLYALLADTVAAGVDTAMAIQTVDMDGFVALSEQFPHQQAWH